MLQATFVSAYLLSHDQIEIITKLINCSTFVLPLVRRVSAGPPSLWSAHQPTLITPPTQLVVLCPSLPLFHFVLIVVGASEAGAW